MHVVTSRTRSYGIDPPMERRDDSAMDLSELSSPQTPVKQQSGELASSALCGDAAWLLANQIGSEVASALTPALAGVHTLQATGRIDRAGLHALVEQIEQARRASMMGQQIARLARGGIQQQPEGLNLTDALHGMLALRQDELNARGMAVKQLLKPAEVVVDATLLSALLNALFDWSLRHTCTPVDIRLDTKPWPAHARLICRYAHTPQDRLPMRVAPAQSDSGHHGAAALNCLSWQLLVQLARTMQLPLERVDTAGTTELTLEFPHTAKDSLEGATAIEWHSDFAISGVAQPLAGQHVLVIALRRDVRSQIQRAVSQMGMTLDFVDSTEAAREFCQQGLPQAIVYESMVYDSAFDSLRNDIKQQCPELAWVEIVEQGEAFEISSFGGVSMARVGRDAIASSLPSALLFELAKGL
jgi:hypothetical protein